MLPRRLRPSKKGCGFANYLVFEQFDLPSSTSGLDLSEVRAIASDNKGVWIIAFGNPRAVYFRSEDNGETWTELSVNNAPNFAPPMDTRDSVYERFGIATDGKGHWKSFGSDRKMYISDDDGKTWEEGNNLQSFFFLYPGDVFINTFLRTDNNGVWFAIGTIDRTAGYESITLRSLDNGANWELYAGKYPQRFNTFSVCSDKNGNWYGCTGTSYTNVNMCKSTDNGETWAETLVFPGIGGSTNRIFGSIFASTTGTIIAAFSGEYFKSPGPEPAPRYFRETMARSVDFGETWEVIYPDVGMGGITSAEPGPVGMLSDDNGFWMNNYSYLICSQDNGKTWFRGPDGMGIDASNTHPVAYGNNRFICGRSYRDIDYDDDVFLKRDSISRSKQFVTGYGSCHGETLEPPVDPGNPGNPGTPGDTECTDTLANKIIFDRFSISEDDVNVEKIVYSNGTWIAVMDVGGTIRDFQKLFRSTDKGNTWTGINIIENSKYPSLEYASLETNGKNKWIILHSNNNYPSFVSVDDGVTWTETFLGLDDNAISDRLTCDRRTDQVPTWIAWGTHATTRSNYRSVDDGVTWTKMNLPEDIDFTKPYTNFRSIAYTGNGKWAAVYEANYDDIYYSNDGALTFSKVYTVQTNPKSYRSFGTTMVSNGKGTVIQLGYTQYGPAPIYRSTNYGQTWTQILPGMNSYGMYRNADLLFTDNNGLWYGVGMFVNYDGSWADCAVSISIDDGLTWQAGPIGFNLAPNTMHRRQVNALCGDYGDGRFIIGNNSKYYCSKSRI